jgi:hypothetical protein
MNLGSTCAVLKSTKTTEEQYDLVGKMREWLHSELLHAGIADKF